MLSVAIAYFIHWNGDGLALHWAFLIVFGFYLLVAALLVFIGVRKVKQVRAPEKAIEQGKQIPRALQGQVLAETRQRTADGGRRAVETSTGVIGVQSPPSWRTQQRRLGVGRVTNGAGSAAQLAQSPVETCARC